MKNMKGSILRKLKSISTPTWSSGLVFQQNNPSFQAFHQTSHLGKQLKNRTLVGENFGISELPFDAKEEKMSSEPNADMQEKSVKSKEDSLLQASESNTDEIVAVPMHDHINCESVEYNEFEARCPPRGKDSIVLYTTSLRGIRKTFEDCNTIRFLLESFRVVYSERDVSMHLEYRDELWGVLGGRVVPPRLFIRGKYIGGADEVVGLHEKGMLRDLLEGMPLSSWNDCCRGCGGIRFLMCWRCNGSRKVMSEGGNDGTSMRCPECNENGLVKCSVCG